MSRHFQFRQNDTSGSVVLVVESGLASTIATASAVFAAVDEDGEAIFTDGIVTISDVTTADDGTKGATLTHSVTSETTGTVGKFWGAFVITYPSGERQTMPASPSLTFTIYPDPTELSAAEEDNVPQGDLQSQASHGLSVGNLVYNNAGTWTKARANADTTLAEALVVSVESTTLFRVVYLGPGEVTYTAHGLGAAGTKLYLSQGTAGAITTTAPTSGIRQQVGKVLSANKIILWPHLVEVL
jgi:hypothetical protein